MDKKSKGKPTRHRSQRHRIQLDGNVVSSASTSQSRTSVENNEIQSSIHTATQSEMDTTKRHSASADADIHASMETSLPIGESQALASLSSPSAGTSATTNSPPGATSPPASPEPNCPICLGKLENKSFTNSCFHMFCFLCLVEWSKVKAECPLCKQSFKSIVHNVRSDLDYDEYYIQQPERIERPTNEFTFPGGRFRYRTTVTDHRYTRQAVLERQVMEREERLLSRPSLRQPTTNWRRLRQPATSDFRQRVYQNRLKAVDSSTTNTRRRVRETSPSFFRENVAQTHRLVPWLNRELNAVLHGHGEQIAFVLELIMGLIKHHPIDSDEFYEHTYPFIGRHTRQFQQEFLRFARSAYHMAAYDRHTIYEPNTDPPNYDSDDEQRPPEENDSDVIVVSPSHSPQQQRRDNAPMRVPAWESTSQYLDSILSRTQTWMNRHIQANTDPNHMQQPIQRSTEASGWDSPIHSPAWNIPTDSSSEDIDIVNTDPSTSHISSSTTTCTSPFLSPVSMQYPTFSMQYPSSTFCPANPYSNLFDNLTHSLPPVVSSFQLPACTAPPPLPAMPSTSTEFPINVDQIDSDSNESDVMIVDYEKPWLERSPIQLSSAESDFDVRITGEHRPGDPEVKHERSRKRQRPKEKEEQAETIVNQQDVPNSRQPETAGDVASKSRSMSHHSHSKRQRHHTISSSDEEKRHREPLILKLLDIPHYKHKKYSKTRRDNSVRRHSKDLWHSPESLTSQSSGDSRHRMSHTSSSLSGSESRVSIRSNKHRTTHSSIKIVEYHKHNRKHKKKHKKRKHSDENHSRKDGERRRHSSHSRQRKHSKSGKSGHSHKRHKHDKRKKRSDTSDDERNITRMGTPSGYSDNSVTVDYAEANFGTNDSCKLTNHNQTEKSGQDALKVNSEGNKDANKPIDFSTYYDKLLNLVPVDSSRISTASVRTAPVDVGNFDIVELPLDKAGYFDKDLEIIAKTLAAPVQETCNTKPFKKHPHGHKKSRKTTDHSTIDLDRSGASDTGKTEDVVNTIDHDSAVARTDTSREENIQSNLISSCTEVFEVGQISTAELSQGAPACLYRTCASPVNFQSTCKFVDVDTISENSDVDIITCADKTDIAHAICRTRKDTPIHVDTTADIIDVVGVSDDENRDNVERDGDIKHQNDYIDVLGCSDSESMSSSQNNDFVEVIKSSTENIDITSVSDDENIRSSNVMTGYDLNALENADNGMCGEDADLTSKSSTYSSNDVISTETTALTDDANLNVVNVTADETGFIKPVETKTELCRSALTKNTEIMSSSEVNYNDSVHDKSHGKLTSQNLDLSYAGKCQDLVKNDGHHDRNCSDDENSCNVRNYKFSSCMLTNDAHKSEPEENNGVDIDRKTNPNLDIGANPSSDIDA